MKAFFGYAVFLNDFQKIDYLLISGSWSGIRKQSYHMLPSGNRCVSWKPGNEKFFERTLCFVGLSENGYAVPRATYESNKRQDNEREHCKTIRNVLLCVTLERFA